MNAPARSTDLADCTATELLALYRSKQASPVEATNAVLARIERVNPKLLAFCHLAPADAIASARASEARWQRGEPIGALDGVPASIKDLILTKGWPTLRGSRTVDANQPWDVDAPASARLREAGAVLLGKTSTPEFGCKGETNSPRTGITRNPWDPSKTPGGSSGGTAAAVAAGLGPLSVGTDGAGSVRIPAAFCGNFGLKPSFGRVPAYPLSPFGTVAHLGPHTMSVRDAALMLTVLARPDARDWTSLPYDARDYSVGLDDGIRGLRIAWSPALGYAKNVHPEVAAACAKAVDDAARTRRARRGGRPGLRRPAGDHLRPVVRRRVDLVEHAHARAAEGHRPRLRRRGRARRQDQRARSAAAEPAARRARLADAPVHAALRPAGHADRRGARIRRQAGRPHAVRSGHDARLDAVLVSRST